MVAFCSRAWKKVESIATDAETGEETSTVTLHRRYIYRGYLQVATCDLTRGGQPCLWLITWDPTQPVATRPLAIQKDGTWYGYGRDLPKNVCEVFGQAGYIRTTYSYTPYGTVTAEGDVMQPLRGSSEYAAPELGLVYYNYRYYNPTDGRWNRRDPIGMEGGMNLYLYLARHMLISYDLLGKKPNACGNDNKKCLCCTVYAEARGQSDDCIIAVMWAIHNRVRSNKNECDVVSEEKQFSSYNNTNYNNCCKNKCKNKPNGSQDYSENVSVQYLCQGYTFDGVDPIDGAEYFHDLSISLLHGFEKE